MLTIYVFPALKTIFGFLIDVGAKVASAMISAFGTILGAITPIINFIIDSINLVIRGINLIKPGADIGYLNKIGQPKLGSSQFSENSGQGKTTSTITPTITSDFSAVSGGATTPIKVPKIPAIDYSINPTLPNGMLDLNAPQNAASARLQAQADAFELSRLRERNALVTQPPNIFTVNIGVAGDPEGVARTVVNTVNDSFYRGTGGAGRFQGF